MSESGKPNNAPELCSYVQARKREADKSRTRSADGKMSLVDLWDRNGRRWHGDFWSEAVSGGSLSVEGVGMPGVSTTEDGLQRFSVNRLQPGIITGLGVQYDRPPVVRLKAAESLDEPEYFLKPAKGRELLRLANAAGDERGFYFVRDAETLAEIGLAVQSGQLTVSGFTRYQLAGKAPLRPDQAQALQMVAPGIVLVEFTPGQLAGDEWFDRFMADAIMAGGAATTDDLFEINDRAVADCAQKVFDNRTDRAGLEFYAIQNGLYCAVFGHQPMLIQWDSVKHLPVYRNPNILNVWIDPNASRVEDADYVIIDYLLTLEQAKARWPKMADEIERAGSEGQRIDAEFTRGSDFGREYERKMLTVEVMWERHVQYPVELAEALELGLVQQIAAVPAVVDEAGQVITSEQPEQLILAETGEQTMPGKGNWPTAAHVRQVQILPDVQIKIDDRRCPYVDIPVGWNINIPILQTPYGLGEPVRVEDLQQMACRTLSILHNHSRYYQFPMMLWPKSLVQLMERTGVKAYTKPGRMIPVDDAIWMQMIAGGGRGLTLQPPPIPGDYVELLRLILGEIDRIMGNVNVLQGEPTSQDMSGIAIGQLQDAARGPLGFKSRYAQWMLKHVATVTLDAIVQWVPEQVWTEIVNQYPWPVLKRIRDRIKETAFDVDVEIVSGKGVLREIEKRDAREMHKAGLLDRRTTMEKNEIANPEEVIRRIDEDAASQARAQMPAPVGVPGQAVAPMAGVQ